MSLLPATSAPKPVRTAALLYLVTAALGVVGIVVGFVLLPSAIDQATRQLRQAGGSAAQGASIVGGAAIGAAVFSAVLTIAFVVLTVVFARRMTEGRNWARIVLAVFAGLQIFGVVGNYGLGAVHFLVGIAALVFSFLPESNAWFRAVSPSRADVI